MNKKKHIFGVVSYISDDTSEQRVENVRKSLATYKNLKKEENFVFVWDNNSCKSHVDFLEKNKENFDAIIYSPNNLYDFASMHCILEIAKRSNAEFVTSIEDDMSINDDAVDAIDQCYRFLEDNQDCKHVKLAKFEYENRHIYDKINKNKDTDFAHAIRMYNQITKEELVWLESKKLYNGRKFFKNNWHWNSFPSVCKTSLFETILPKENIRPLMALENEMMIRFHKQGLKTGILNGGCIVHNQPNFSPSYSIRVANEVFDDINKTISYTDVTREVNRLIEDLKI